MVESKQKKLPVYAFIDSQNLNLGIKSQGWSLDWRKFRLYLKNKYSVVKTFLFIGHIDGNEPLYTSLQESGYTLIFKPTIDKKEGTKGNVDAELVLHSMIQYNHYSKAVIISGDGDFYCLIQYLFQKNKLLKILVPNSHYSSLLRKFYQQIVLVDVLRKSLQYIKKTKISNRSKP